MRSVKGFNGYKYLLVEFFQRKWHIAAKIVILMQKTANNKPLWFTYVIHNQILLYYE